VQSSLPTYSLNKELKLLCGFHTLELVDSKDNKPLPGFLPVCPEEPNLIDLDHKPLHVALNDIFQDEPNIQPAQPPEVQNTNSTRTTKWPPAFLEDPTICSACMCTFILATFCRNTQRGITETLHHNASILCSICNCYPGVHLEGLNKMAQSLWAVE
jgi:hypothetical protein